MDCWRAKILLDACSEWYHRRRKLLGAGRLGAASAAAVHEFVGLTSAASGVGAFERWFEPGDRMTEITRREAMQRLMAAVAAGVVVPAIVGAADWKPIFLSEKQDEMLGAVAETMVPGSGAALVNRFVDLLLSVDSADRQKGFVSSLAAVDEVSRSQFQKAFAELSAGEREKVITSLSQNHKEAFADLKEWIVEAYYSSEVGMKELGWDGNFAFDKYPTCEAVEGRS